MPFSWRGGMALVSIVLGPQIRFRVKTVTRRRPLPCCRFRYLPLPTYQFRFHALPPCRSRCLLVLGPLAKNAFSPGSYYDHVTCHELHHLCRRRGFTGRDSKVVPKTRLSAMDAAERRRNRDAEVAMDTSGDSSVTQEECCRLVDPHLAFFCG